MEHRERRDSQIFFIHLWSILILWLFFFFNVIIVMVHLNVIFYNVIVVFIISISNTQSSLATYTPSNSQSWRLPNPQRLIAEYNSGQKKKQRSTIAGYQLAISICREEKRRERRKADYKFVASCNTDSKILCAYERCDHMLMV